MKFCVLVLEVHLPQIVATRSQTDTYTHFPEIVKSCSGHPKTCKSMKNRKSKICTKPVLSSVYIEESKKKKWFFHLKHALNQYLRLYLPYINVPVKVMIQSLMHTDEISKETKNINNRVLKIRLWNKYFFLVSHAIWKSFSCLSCQQKYNAAGIMPSVETYTRSMAQRHILIPLWNKEEECFTAWGTGKFTKRYTFARNVCNRYLL